MTLRASTDRLHAALGALVRDLAGLSRRASDSPPENAARLAEALADAADAMAGWAAEAGEPLEDAPRERVPALLVRAHRRILRIAADLDDWTSYTRVADLVSAGQEGGRVGRDWSLDVRDALEGCRTRLARVEHRLLAGWQEVAEAEGSAAVSVRAVSVGQQVSLAPHAARDVDPESIGGETGAVGP
jgi:hypothetical protein